MYIFFSFFFLILGIIIGSFLNVVILRYNTGLGLSGRSRCFSCSATLSWYELIPVVSFLFLGARCKSCKSALSWQYPLVELTTGLLFMGVFMRLIPASDPFQLFLTGALPIVSFYLFVMALFVVITVYDIRHTIIPDAFVYTFIGVSLLRLILELKFSLLEMPYLLDLFSGPFLFTCFFLLWLISRGRWMGFGDAKLVLGIGWFLGFSYGLSAVVLAFWIGAVVSVIYLALGKLLSFKAVRKLGLSLRLKHLTIKSEIPFAPYLILGALLVFFFSIDVLHIKDFINEFFYI